MNTKLLLDARQARLYLAFSVLCGTLAAATTIVQMFLLSQVVNRVFLVHQSLNQLSRPLLVLLGAIILRAAFVWLREVTAQESAVRVKSNTRQRLFAHLLQSGPGYTKGQPTGELVTTLSEGIERLDPYVSRYLPQVALSVLIPILIIACIFPFDWTSAILLLVTGPVIPLLMILVGSYAEKHVQRQWLSLSRMSAYFLDAVQGLATLKLFGRGESTGARVASISDQFRQKTMKMLRVAFLSGMVLEFMTAVTIGLIAVTLGVRLLNNGITFEHAFLILLLAPEFYRPLRDLGVQRHAAMEGKAAMQRISEILRTPAEINTSSTQSTGRPSLPLTITFSNVTYTYPGKETPALRDLTLTLPAGSCTALIGRSGAGKSTLVNMLLRFMNPQSGQITVNDIPLAELTPENWREYVALVPQHPYLFYGNVLDNIRMARPTASDAEVIEAAKLAGASEFINAFPQGYATAIGERGIRLSAGQAQRLAIARAFLKNAPLLILDEPTSNLDPESETHIRSAIHHLTKNRTVLVIAHRYNTIASADRVAVLEKGTLVEIHTPDILLQDKNAFTNLIPGKVGIAR